MIPDKYARYRPEANFIKRYMDEKCAAESSDYDPNSNVSSKNLATLASESGKRGRIYTSRLMMHDMLAAMYGEEEADSYINNLETHRVYCHDETGQIPQIYCASITMYPFLLHGLKGLGGTSDAPKTLQSFAGGFVNLVFAASAQVLGAIATPEFLAYMNYFLVKEYGEDYYLKPDTQAELFGRKRTIDNVITDTFAQVVYSVNQPAAARGNQAVFWNISYFDEPYFRGLFEGFAFPDGTVMTDLWESLWWLQVRFMKWFNQERLRKIITFPVETFSLLNDGKTAVDQRALKHIAEMYAEGHSFFTYTSDSVDSLSSCCFAPDTLFSIWDQHNTLLVGAAARLYQMLEQEQDFRVRVLLGEEVVPATFIRLPGRQMYFITIDIAPNARHMYEVTDNHLFPTRRGDIQAKELVEGDEVQYWDPENRVYSYRPVSEVIESANTYDYVYCLEVDAGCEPYFMLPSGVITHNCRLKNNIVENQFTYSLGAGGIATGSKRVMTININRLVQECGGDMAKVKASLDDLTAHVHRYLKAYNAMVKDAQAKHMIPLYDAGFVSPEKQYLTVGINGLVEAAEYLGIPVGDNKGYSEFTDLILDTIHRRNVADAELGVMFNTEYVPAESLGVKNAKWDKADGLSVPRACYNSYFFVVEDPQTTVLDKIRLHGDRYIRNLDGGSACHINLEEHLTARQYELLILNAIHEGCSYFTFNVPNTICNDCGHISKHKLEKCPKCGSENLDYATRIIGYLTRVSKWSAERKNEYDRRYFGGQEYEDQAES